MNFKGPAWCAFSRVTVRMSSTVVEDLTSFNRLYSMLHVLNPVDGQTTAVVSAGDDSSTGLSSAAASAAAAATAPPAGRTGRAPPRGPRWRRGCPLWRGACGATGPRPRRAAGRRDAARDAALWRALRRLAPAARKRHGWHTACARRGRAARYMVASWGGVGSKRVKSWIWMATGRLARHVHHRFPPVALSSPVLDAEPRTCASSADAGGRGAARRAADAALAGVAARSSASPPPDAAAPADASAKTPAALAADAAALPAHTDAERGPVPAAPPRPPALRPRPGDAAAPARAPTPWRAGGRGGCEGGSFSGRIPRCSRPLGGAPTALDYDHGKGRRGAENGFTLLLGLEPRRPFPWS